MNKNLKPILDQIKDRIGNTDEIRDAVLKNIEQTRGTLEATAKQIEASAKQMVEQTKDSKFMTEYLRPAIESEKTEDALNQLQAKIAQASPLVEKLKELRKQFLKATKNGAATKSAGSKKKKKMTKKSDS